MAIIKRAARISEMIHNKFIHYNNSSLHYAKTGNGEKHLLVFHGFGQDLNVFDFLSRSLARHYTFYVFDLYFHGKSEWAHGEKPLEKNEWRETMKLFFSEHQIDEFQIAAFSLGGKFALATLEAFPEKTKKLYLIAPDGIKTSFWYNLATYPVLFRKFFRSMILHPDRFSKLTKFLIKTGLVDKGLIRFAEYQMGTVEKRKRVYYSWVVFRRLRFATNHIAELINTNQISTIVILGRHDKVIEPQNIEPFLKKIKNYRLEVLDSGHTGLINQSLPFFTE